MAERYSPVGLLFPDEDHFRAVMDEAEATVARQITDLYVEELEEYGMPPLRGLFEYMDLLNVGERDGRLMEIMAITVHNQRAQRMGRIGEVITLNIPPSTP